jgi:hypothetical protein
MRSPLVLEPFDLKWWCTHSSLLKFRQRSAHNIPQSFNLLGLQESSTVLQKVIIKSDIITPQGLDNLSAQKPKMVVFNRNEDVLLPQ